MERNEIVAKARAMLQANGPRTETAAMTQFQRAAVRGRDDASQMEPFRAAVRDGALDEAMLIARAHGHYARRQGLIMAEGRWTARAQTMEQVRQAWGV